MDSLTCGVCGENFRERHHLTRHMTAHVARKGEPDDKTNIAKSNRSTNINQNCMKQDVKNFGNMFSTFDSSNDSNHEKRTFKLL